MLSYFSPYEAPHFFLVPFTVFFSFIDSESKESSNKVYYDPFSSGIFDVKPSGALLFIYLF